MLIIMDGWGLGSKRSADAIASADTPFVDSLYSRYPNTTLVTYGKEVGLPEGQMGNSEVGHLNIGAGRIVYQELQRIFVAIEDGSLERNTSLQAAFNAAKAPGKTLHLMGLVSDGGVHSHTAHLRAMLSYAAKENVPHVVVHAFTDGRDTDPHSGKKYIADLQEYLNLYQAQLASITGRYYAMDRDRRWERVQKAYNALVRGNGTLSTDPVAAMEASYAAGITDEFIEPIIMTEDGTTPLALIKENDVVICFNFRTDRCREITEVLTQHPCAEYNMHPLHLHYLTMTEYDKTYHHVGVIFTSDNLNNTLGAVLEQHNKTQIRIAETEKYPHVTFFFSGGRELEFKGEKRLLCPSPKEVPTYDLKPEMSAYDITRVILPEIKEQTADFICLNFANADMVGHTGVFDAAVSAAETVDKCVSQIVPAALAAGYAVFLTADHGNADYIVNEDGSPNTAHTMNPVPFFLISNDYKGELQSGKLADIAPSILYYMGITIPEEMTGKILLEE